MTAIKRTASAHWEGTGKDGTGVLSTASPTLAQTPYSFSSRFADGAGTNPEELIAAAHAGCFAMKLAFVLQEAGLTPTHLDVACEVVLDGGAVTHSNLRLTAAVPGVEAEKFAALAEEARANCPISKLLNTTITLAATLQP